MALSTRRASLGGMRSAPVDRLVVEVAHGRERGRAPAHDAVGDLEPAPDRMGRHLARSILDRIARQELADRDDVPDRHPGRALAGMPAVLFSSKDAAEVEPRRQIRRLSELVESR